MSSFFGGSPRTPGAMYAPLPPSTSSEDANVKRETADALANAQSVERKTKGRASTVLTSGIGLSNDELLTSKKYLLGT